MASASVGCAFSHSGSSHMRYALSSTSGLAATGFASPNDVPVTVKKRPWSYISTSPRRQRPSAGLGPRKYRCRPSPLGDTSVYVSASSTTHRYSGSSTPSCRTWSKSSPV